EILIKAGALLDHTYTDIDGNELSGNAKKLYDAAMRVQAKLVPKLKKGEDVEADQNMIAQAKEVLKKMGYAPGERFVNKSAINKSANRAVAFADTNEKMTGAAVKKALEEAVQNRVTAYEFLSTGAGNAKQASLKEQMHDDLKAKLQDQARELD